MEKQSQQVFSQFIQSEFLAEDILYHGAVSSACDGYNTVEFYQGNNGQCIVEKTTLNELFQQKLDAGYDANSRDAIFLVGKTGIKLVDRKEYEQIKTSIKKHPYDPSLCKPRLVNNFLASPHFPDRLDRDIICGGF